MPQAASRGPNALHVIIPHSVIDMLYQSTIAILLLVGFESATAFGSEAKNPQRDIKRGVLISLLIQGGVCYLFEYFSANLAIGGAALTTGTGPAVAHGYAAAAGDAAPIGDMIKTVGNRYLGHSGQTLAVLVALTVLLALVGTALASLNTAVRITYAMSKDKEMPTVLGLLHGRFASPHGGIVVLHCVSAALGVFGADPHQVDNLTQITLASNLGTFLVYGATCAIALDSLRQPPRQASRQAHRRSGSGAGAERAGDDRRPVHRVDRIGYQSGRRLQGVGRGRALGCNWHRLGFRQPQQGDCSGDRP